MFLEFMEANVTYPDYENHTVKWNKWRKLFRFTFESCELSEFAYQASYDTLSKINQL